MSAGNRKNPQRPSVTSPPPQLSKGQFIYLLALVVAAGLLIGLIVGGLE